MTKVEASIIISLYKSFAAVNFPYIDTVQLIWREREKQGGNYRTSTESFIIYTYEVSAEYILKFVKCMLIICILGTNLRKPGNVTPY